MSPVRVAMKSWVEGLAGGAVAGMNVEPRAVEPMAAAVVDKEAAVVVVVEDLVAVAAAAGVDVDTTVDVAGVAVVTAAAVEGDLSSMARVDGDVGV